MEKTSWFGNSSEKQHFFSVPEFNKLNIYLFLNSFIYLFKSRISYFWKLIVYISVIVRLSSVQYLAGIWGHGHSGYWEWPHLASEWLVFHTGTPLQGLLCHSSLASSLCSFEIALCLPLALRQYLHPVHMQKAPSQSIILITVTYQP